MKNIDFQKILLNVGYNTNQIQIDYNLFEWDKMTRFNDSYLNQRQVNIIFK